MRPALALAPLAALAVSLSARPVSAQDGWTEVHRGAVSGRVPFAELGSDLTAVEVPSDAALRVVLTGTLTDGIDGAELDAIARFSRGARDETYVPLVLPAGARVVQADETAHRYTIELAPGTPLRFGLDVAGLAARHLVTASELRSRLSGAIELELLVPTAALPTPAATTAAAEPISGPWLPGIFGGLFGAAALALVARRRRMPEDLLARRALRAHAAIGARAKALGPQFEGALAPAEKLLAAVRAGRGHLVAIDRALAETSFVGGAAAIERRAELARDRAEAVGRIERAVGALEEALVRLGASTADRSAATGLERSLDDLAAEVDVGRDVDRELGLRAP